MYQTQHFKANTEDKLACSCCGLGGLDIATLIVLEDVRRHFEGKAVSVISGARCVKHNAKEGGAKKSEHLATEEDHNVSACDIRVSGVKPSVVAAYLESTPFANLLGIGRYATFTHVDTRGYPARWKA